MAPAPPVRPPDAIGDFLRTQPAAEKHKLTRAAQEALARLGFAVKPTGALDSATRSALASFEKAHRLPVSTEITPRLVHALKAADAAD